MSQVESYGVVGQKQKIWKSRAYLNWVKRQPCVIRGAQADDPHHIIGVGDGKMGGKASDLFAFPLTRYEHNLLHHDVNQWEAINGSQWKFVAQTIEEAVRQGILNVSPNVSR